jgi:aryl-alcohol dehydrogenase-like predicted oxidoreductase
VAGSQPLTDGACDSGRDATCDVSGGAEEELRRRLSIGRADADVGPASIRTRTPVADSGLGPVVGLGCMRLSTDPDRDEERALATLAAALDAGITLLDTARAYGHGEADLGHNERLIARALAAAPARAAIRIVTKGGMSRARGGWTPDGRARTLRADAEASAVALGRPADVWLLHAPDPRVPFATSLRAMAAIVDSGAAAAVGVSNVNRLQLEEALAALPIAAVEVAIGPRDDTALRGGVVELCASRGIPILAHTPLGGTLRAPALAADPVLAALAAERGVSAAQIVLAWLRSLAPGLVPLPGARRPATARAAAVQVALDDDARARLAVRFPAGALAAPRPRAAPTADGEVVLVMGIPGAGKSRAVAAWTDRGHQRFNRDQRGGDLRTLAADLDAAIAGGDRRLVLDNTYLTRAARADVLSVASKHGLAARGVWLDTAPAVAQVNLCARYLAELGALPGPDQLRRPARAGVMAPTQHMRLVRQVEPPTPDEGFASLEVVPFARAPDPALVAGRVIALEALASHVVDEVPTVAIGWRPAGDGVEAVAGVDVAICPHAAGPPVCWCRPPLPGLVVAWAHRRGVDLARLAVIGPAPTFRTLARALGAPWRPLADPGSSLG